MFSFLYGLHMYADFGLLILRLAVGVIFLYHCRSKLSGAQGSFMRFIGYCELLGGIAMILGFLTQLAGLGLGIIMLGAIYKKINEWNIPFASKTTTGWEFDMMILSGCIALMTLGGGLFALDWPMFGL